MTEGPGTRLIEELRLLLDAVADRAGPWLDRVAAGTRDDPAGDWCPVCAARALNRAADLVALLRAVLADRWDEPGAPHLPGFRPEPRPDPRVQHIPIRRKGKPD